MYVSQTNSCVAFMQNCFDACCNCKNSYEPQILRVKNLLAYVWFQENEQKRKIKE